MNSDIDISRFFTWWGQELSFLLPQKFRESLTRGKSFLTIESVSNKAKICYINQDEEVLLGLFSFDALAKEELQEIIDENSQYKDAEVVLRVPKDQSIKQDIFLPVAAESNTQQVLTYELDKYTPFNKDQVHFDTIKFEKKKDASHIQLLLILVKKETLQVLYDKSLSLGLTPHFADSENQKVISGDSASRYNLLPANLCKKSDKTPFFIMLGSILLSFILLVILFVYPLNRLDTGIERLKRHTRLVENVAQEIEQSKKGVDFLYSTTKKVIEKQNELPAMVDVIDTVSQIFNDETWVSQFRFVKKSLQLTGQSVNASSLIELLEKEPIFHNAKFISPVTKDNRTGMERFKISMDVKKDKPKDKLNKDVE